MNEENCKQTNNGDNNKKKKMTAVQHRNMPGFVTVTGELLSDKFTLKKLFLRGRRK